MSWDYRDENVLLHAHEAFQETIALKLLHLRRYIKKGTNSALTGDYVEEIVRSFVRKWISPLQLRHGTFYSQEFEQSGEGALQIDGIVWNPHAGPAILEEGDFIVVHPVFCTSVIEIKTSIGPIGEFQQRLQAIHRKYMHWGGTPMVMGIVISDTDPEKKSQIKAGEKTTPAFHYHLGGWCPIFILYKESPEGDFTPYEPAIEAMIRSIHMNQRSAGNFM